MAISITIGTRNMKHSNVLDLGVTPRKKQETTETKRYGDLSYKCDDYRTLPADDPRRMEIEQRLASMPAPTGKRPCTAVGGAWK